MRFAQNIFLVTCLLLLFGCANEKTTRSNVIEPFPYVVDEESTIIKSGETFVGNDEIENDFLFSSTTQLEKELFFTTANKEREIEYRIVQVAREEQQTDFGVLITQNTIDQKRLNLLYLTEGGDEAPNWENEINERRAAWMKTCNNHNVTELINEFYSITPFYYNHKPLVSNPAALIQEYSYMANENYQLTLTTLFKEPVNSSTVYEIGQCSGSYNGKYILVWVKEDGEWKIKFDSNI